MIRALFTVLALLGLTGEASSDRDIAAERRQMVEEIKQMAAETAKETGVEEFNSRVLKAMGEVPRHEFVPHEQVGDAYKNRPLSIDHGQTISQPFIVALMSELLQVKDTDKVLEVGTGFWLSSRDLICARPGGVLDRDRSRTWRSCAECPQETGLRQCRSQDRRWLSGVGRARAL